MKNNGKCFQTLLHTGREEQTESRVTSFPNKQSENNDDTGEITIEEITEAIKMMKNVKALGPDKVTARMVKYMEPKAIQYY